MNSSDIRYRARQDLAGKWGVAILAGFLAASLGGLVSSSGGGNFDLDQQEIARLPDVLKTYPWYKLPLKQAVFAFTMKYRLYLLQKIMVLFRAR